MIADIQSRMYIVIQCGHFPTIRIQIHHCVLLATIPFLLPDIRIILQTMITGIADICSVIEMFLVLRQ